MMRLSLLTIVLCTFRTECTRGMYSDASAVGASGSVGRLAMGAAAHLRLQASCPAGSLAASAHRVRGNLSH